eukprot:GFYU01005100.1.p1 GENE.GFYU01005100.1~~GFYU01005100.1.p1  ORF type:complete len:507 (-),score=144.41 GFYU01005100.1:154-1674(-)
MVSQRDAKTWQNWSGHVSCQYDTLITPQTEEEIQDAVRCASESGTTVRVIGSGHSFNTLACTNSNGVMLSLHKYQKLLNVDHDKCQVEVQAGMFLHQIHDTLAKYGLSLQNMGVIAEQSVAGAISTGTHGSGVTYPNLSARIVACRIVLANGDLMTISETENSQYLPAVRISLGTLGVFSTVTLQCVPEFKLKSVEYPMKFTTALEELPRLAQQHEFVKVWWFPHTDYVQVFEINRIEEQEHKAICDAGASAEAQGAIPVFKSWWENRVIGRHCTEAMFYAALKKPSLVPMVNRQLRNRLFYKRVTSGRSDHVLCGRQHGDESDGLRMNVNEIAIPIENAVPALRDLSTMLAREGLFMHFPVDIRFTAPDDTWLSPAYQRRSCYIGICARKPYMMEDPQCPKVFALFERIMKSHGGRPHWGKLHTFKRNDLHHLYPKFEDFLAVRETLDPTGVFLNPHTEQLFGVKSTQPRALDGQSARLTPPDVQAHGQSANGYRSAQHAITSKL